ncbi:MAG TPA: hypothetical protein VJA47_02510 [archaeon]|nr:hypothetical protein [archaeon]
MTDQKARWEERNGMFLRKHQYGMHIRGNLPSLAGVLDRLYRLYQALETGGVRDVIYFGCDRIDFITRLDHLASDSDTQSPLYGSKDHLEMGYRGSKEVV